MSDDATETVYRLTDIETEEVSIVDRAANQRKFLIVKNKGADDMKTGAPIVSDGKGGHTVVKEVPETPPAPPAAAPPAPEVPPMTEPIFSLSPEAKEELLKRCARAAERLSALKAIVDGATVVAGLVEVPATIVEKVAELLTGIAEGEKVEKADAKIVLLKGLPQFSGARVSQLQAAHEALGAVLSTIVAPTPPAPAPEVEAPEETIAKAVAKAVAPIEAKVAKGLDAIAAIVSSQSIAIEKQAGRVLAVETSRPTPRSVTPSGAAETVAKGDDEDNSAWPSDMADPEKHDVTKVDKGLRFTTTKS